ncbi:MAG: M15 family metallopeptidase [Pseudomonadales bacterium]|nr:M15 family metallopeptidase [Pseudomonadales bacterium]
MNFQTVQHAYFQVSDAERDEYTGCTVCEEDQVEVEIVPLAPFKICRYLAPELVPILRELVTGDEPLYTVVGYRVGKTRGKIDSDGNRTIFSNHSYGISIDINQQQNGLYDNCEKFDQYCRLIRGGEWELGQLGSLSEESIIVRAMGEIGLQWGGRIKGKQKDFMHFSPTGY